MSKKKQKKKEEPKKQTTSKWQSEYDVAASKQPKPPAAPSPVELTSHTTSETNDWESRLEIEPLRRDIPPPEPFPVEALGSVLSPVVKVVQSVIRAPMALVAQSFLAGAAVSVQGVANLAINSSNAPLCEFFLTIAESGERKSAVDNIAMAPHRGWQKQQYKTYKVSEQKYQADLSKKKESNDEPIPPRAPILLCEDPTFEGIFKQLDVGIPGIGLFSDEGGRMLGGHAMNAENRLKTVASLSKLWDGRELDRIRAGDGARVIYGRRCSVHLMAQPSAANTFLEDGVSSDQGILSRFLIAKPDSTKGTRTYVDQDLRHSPAVVEYSDRVTELLDKWSWDDGSGELRLATLSISAEAKKNWIRYSNNIEARQSENGEYRVITGLASKAAEHAARLASIIQLFDDPEAREIGADYMGKGMTLMDFYLGEAVRLRQSASIDYELMQAEKLLEWLNSENLKQIYPAKVYQHGPAAFRTKAKAERAIKCLEAHGHLLRISADIPIEIDGIKRKKAWKIMDCQSV